MSYTPAPNPWKNVPYVGALIDGIQSFLATLTTTITVRKETVDVGSRPAIDFHEGTLTTLTIADDNVNDEVDVTVAVDTSGAIQFAQLIGYGVFSSRPAAGTEGRLYYATDTFLQYRDNGSSWDIENFAGGAGYGVLSGRPAAGITGSLYYATDTKLLYRDNGATWDTLTWNGEDLALSDVTTNDVSTSKHGFQPKAPNAGTGVMLDSGAYGAVTEGRISLSDVTTDDVSTSRHGFAPKAPNAGTGVLLDSGSYGAVTEGRISLSDVTTDDVSTSAHGFAPKGTNTGYKFLRDDAGYYLPPVQVHIALYNAYSGNNNAFPLVTAYTAFEGYEWHFLDGGQGYLYGRFRVPVDVTPVSQKIELVWTSTATSGNAVTNVTTKSMGDNANYNPASFSGSGSSTFGVQSTTNYTKKVEYTITGETWAAGDLVNVIINRDGGNGSDTLTSDLILLSAVAKLS